MDYRLEEAAYRFLKERDLVGKTDIISIAGGAKNLAEGSGLVAEQIKMAVRMHRPNTVFLMNHSDCGGYGGTEAFTSDITEVKKHRDDLDKAAEAIAEMYPWMVVRLLFAIVTPQHNGKPDAVQITEITPL